MSSNLSLNFLQFRIGMGDGSHQSVYAFDRFRLDTENLMLYDGGREVSLPPKAVKTLAVLVENHGAILSKDQLIDAVWQDSVVEESNLSQYLYKLRKILGERPGGGPYIETLRRRGYRFTGESVELGLEPIERKNDVPTDRPSTPPHGVERPGNVVALAAWKDAGIPSTRSTPEIPQAMTHERRLPWPVIFAVAVPVILVVLFAGRYWLANSRAESSVVPSETSVLQLTDGIALADATISPDGRYFVYHVSDGKRAAVWLQQTGQSTRIEIVPDAEREIGPKTFSPDGQFIYFVARSAGETTGTLYRVPTLGGPLTKILAGFDMSSCVAFSPDGREMTYHRQNVQTGENSYVIRASDGSGEEKVIHSWNEKTLTNGNPAWSPDGKTIVFGIVTPKRDIVGTCSLMTVDVKSGTVSSLSNERWDTCYRTAWSPDGKGLYLIGTKEAEGYSTRRDQLYYVSYPQGVSRRLTTSGNRHQPMSLGVTNDNAVLAVPFDRSSQIWVMDPNGDTRTAVQLTSGLADGRPGLAPLSDGRVAYIARTADKLNVWLMDQDGSGRKQLTVDPPVVEELRAGGLGRYLVFSAPQDRTSHLFRINSDGSGLRQLTFGDGLEGDSAVSPDEKWVVYDSTVVSSKSVKLWKLPIDGGEPVDLGIKNCVSPHFSPDGSLISCVENDSKLTVISSADGAVVRSFTPVTGYLVNFGVPFTPDGKAVAYLAEVKGATNLWLQPLDGKPARQLTDFTIGSIYRFAYSRDGQRLFIARGTQVLDAVLIKASG